MLFSSFFRLGVTWVYFSFFIVRDWGLRVILFFLLFRVGGWDYFSFFIVEGRGLGLFRFFYCLG